jgi:hypothetical protein
MATLFRGVAIFLYSCKRLLFKRSVMVRWIAFMLLTGCMAAQVPATPAQNQEAAPGQAAEQAPATQPGAPTAAGEFPFDRFKEFSAIMVGSVLSGDDREGHIYRSGNVLRTQGTEGLGYFIIDLESFQTYGLTKLGCTTDSHVYFRAFPFTASRPKRKVETVVTGKESVDGHTCQVEDVTISGGDLALPIKLKFWEAEDLGGFPIKVQILNGKRHNIIQYKDVVVGPVDPTLFIHPKHCVLSALPESDKQKPSAKKKKVSPAAGKPQP